MSNNSICPECGRSNLYISKDIASGSPYGPNYLPGLGSFLSSAKLRVVVCVDCGLTRFFASEKALDKLPESNEWNKL